MLFLNREKQRQESFKLHHWPELCNGQGVPASSRTSPCHLPRGHEAKAFFPPAAAEILTYCRQYRIPILAEARNLKSSLVSCMNTLFFLRDHSGLAILSLESVLPELDEVLRIEFFFPSGGQAAWSGPRADAAVWWQTVSGRKCLSLVCWKYTEASYGTCGGFRSRNNPDQRHCLQMDPNDPQQTRGCYLYWEMNPWLPWHRPTETGIRPDAFQGVSGCPFRGPFYQIMREFLLAAALRRSENVDQVEVVFVGFRENLRLTKTPVHLAPLGNDLIRTWNKVLLGVPKLRYVLADEIVNGLRRDRSGTADVLVCYLEKRYGLY